MNIRTHVARDFLSVIYAVYALVCITHRYGLPSFKFNKG